MSGLGPRKKDNASRMDRFKEHLPQLSNEMQLSIMNKVKSGELSIEDALNQARLDQRQLLHQQCQDEEVQQSSQYNFSVHKHGRYRWQKRVLQIDFKTKMICSIEKGIVKRQLPFSRVKSCDDSVGSRFSISFREHHDYELEATSLEDKHKMVQLVNQIIYANIYSQDTEGGSETSHPQSPVSRSIREGVLLLHRGGLASFKWVKYEVQLHPGQLVLLPLGRRAASGDEGTSPVSMSTVVHLSDGDTRVEKSHSADTFTLVTHKNQYHFRVPTADKTQGSESVQEDRDAWARAIDKLCVSWKRKSMLMQINEEPKTLQVHGFPRGAQNALDLFGGGGGGWDFPPGGGNQSDPPDYANADAISVGEDRLSAVGVGWKDDPPAASTQPVAKPRVLAKPAGSDAAALEPDLLPPSAGDAAGSSSPAAPTPVHAALPPPSPLPSPPSPLPSATSPIPSRPAPPPPPPLPPPPPVATAPPQSLAVPPFPGSGSVSSTQLVPETPKIPPPPPLPLRLRTKSKPAALRTKAFHWDVVSSDKIEKSIWAKGSARKIKIDTSRLFQQFSAQDVGVIGVTESVNTTHILLNQKVAHNFNIFLKSFPVQPAELKDKLFVVNEDDGGLSDEQIASLRRYVPTADDVEMYKSHKGPVDELHIVDRYMMEMCNIPYLSARLDLLLTLRELPVSMDDLQPLISQKSRMCTQLYHSGSFVSVLEYLLAVGNYLNENSGKGKAKGFRLSSLTKLSQLRSRDRKFTLLHALVEQILSYEPGLVAFVQELAEFEAVPGASIKGLTAEVDVLKNELQKVIQYKKTYKKRKAGDQHHNFSRDLKAAVVKHKADLSVLTKKCEEMKKLYSAILVKFGEPMDQDSRELFGLVCHFIHDFKTVHATFL